MIDKFPIPIDSPGVPMLPGPMLDYGPPLLPPKAVLIMLKAPSFLVLINLLLALAHATALSVDWC